VDLLTAVHPPHAGQVPVSTASRPPPAGPRASRAGEAFPRAPAVVGSASTPLLPQPRGLPDPPPSETHDEAHSVREHARRAVRGGPLYAQTGQVTGTVTSSEGARPLSGATVAVVGGAQRAVTGPDGRYTLRRGPPAGTG
jgi:hypothetical protein